jgi:hypothetical protein
MKVTKEFIESIGGNWYLSGAIGFVVILDDNDAEESGYTSVITNIPIASIRSRGIVTENAKDIMCKIFEQLVKRGIEIGKQIAKKEIRNALDLE